MIPSRPLLIQIITRIIYGVVLLTGTTSQFLLAQTDVTPRIQLEPVSGSTPELIRLLEEKSGWVISYSSRLPIPERGQLSGHEKTLLQHVSHLFKDAQFSYTIRSNRLILTPPPKREIKHTISGFVREAGSMESLPAANIYTSPDFKGTVSNNYGFFSITLIPGKHTLNASYVGYQTESKPLELNNDTVIVFNLQPHLLLGEIDVVGQLSYAQLNAARMGNILIPIHEIKQTPALLGETDIVKNIQMLPGIQGGSEGFSGLYVRGGGPDQNLILLDDVPIYNIGHLLGFFSVFNADAVKHVSVLKSGFPARYGGRISSVIDIRMLEGNNERVEGNINVGLLSSGVSLNGPVQKDRSGFAISFRRTYMDAIAALAQRGQEETTNYYFFDLNAKYNHIINDKNRLYLSAYWGRDKYMTTYNFVDLTLNNGSPGGEPLRTTINDENNAGWGNVVTALRWNHVFNQRLFGNLTATFSDYRFFIGVERNHEINNNWDSFEQRYISGIRDYSVKVDFDYYPANNHQVKFGLNAIQHEFNPGVDVVQRSPGTSQPVDTTLGDVRLTGGEYHFYLEDEFTLMRKLRVNAGARYVLFNGNDKFYHSLEPRISLNYELSPMWNMRTAYSHMSQFIHLVSSSNVALPTDLWLPVTETIPPMYSRQVSLGTDWKSGFNQNYSISGDVYYKQMKNLLHYKESTGFFDYSTEWEDKLTGGDGESYGLELILRKNNGDFTGWLSYTLAKTTNQFEEINNGRSFPARFDRRHDINLNLKYQFNERIDGNLNWQFGSGTPITLPSEKYFAPDFPFLDESPGSGFSEDAVSLNQYRMPPFHRMDVGFNFSKQRDRTERIWSLGVINLYGRQNPFLLYFASDSNSEPGSAQRNLKQLSLFPFPIPYVRWTLIF
ncbi:TonB-dependent receptor [Alkalitalea saponilacus]|uniref:Outer membrane receptor proteins, mostly Fe transport n=1 Tax=Alkalitalea saponilacus TaxID=889453 RepID=A0A1T5G9T8_9BACT|nr:TonB-dependent receptor [Alkalitalea saponilacus]ASB47906.1 hypothetical protein CDL62_01440 [Alkalitalea saponilacus]SKC05263.1 Outer membrane receptor proteins, mostly Fe transport [Alkalitalea saponilacus]